MFSLSHLSLFWLFQVCFVVKADSVCKSFPMDILIGALFMASCMSWVIFILQIRTDNVLVHL